MNKMQDQIDTVAADNLVPPGITVVSYSPNDGLVMWWCGKTGYLKTPEAYRQEVIRRLKIEDGSWWFETAHEVEGNNYPMSFKVYILENTNNIDLGEHTFVMEYQDFLNHYMSACKVQPINSVPHKYSIETVYMLDNTLFATLGEAQDHLKRIQLYERLAEVQSMNAVELNLFDSIVEQLVKESNIFSTILLG